MYRKYSRSKKGYINKISLCCCSYVIVAVAFFRFTLFIPFFFFVFVVELFLKQRGKRNFSLGLAFIFARRAHLHTPTPTTQLYTLLLDIDCCQRYSTGLHFARMVQYYCNVYICLGMHVSIPVSSLTSWLNCLLCISKFALERCVAAKCETTRRCIARQRNGAKERWSGSQKKAAKWNTENLPLWYVYVPCTAFKFYEQN